MTHAMARHGWRVLKLTALFLCMACGMPAAADDAAGYERRLLNALDDVRNDRLEQALSDMESLVHDKPDFRLAQLVYADLLTARQGPIYDVGGTAVAPARQIEELRDELRARWGYNAEPVMTDRLPLNLLALPDITSHAVVVDLDDSRLFLFENNNGMPRLVEDFYVSIGKLGYGKLKEGDKRTPVGAYMIKGYLPSSELPDFYGYGAFPLDYPNTWDRRSGRTGSGIWLHGTPVDTYSRAPRASDGCVTLANLDLESIASLLSPGTTPVVLADKVQWAGREQWQRMRGEFRERMVQWENDWESRDADRYLRHYSREFSASGKDFEQWAAHKRRVNGAKKFIAVDVEATGVYVYPGESDLIMVQFEQDYRSDNFTSRGRKQQFWRREADGVWRIIYEGPA